MRIITLRRLALKYFILTMGFVLLFVYYWKLFDIDTIETPPFQNRNFLMRNSYKACIDILPDLSDLSIKEVFQPIERGRPIAYAFSAYFDQRGPKQIIKVIILRNIGYKNPLLCQLFYTDAEDKWTSVLAKPRRLHDHLKRPYQSEILDCENPIRESVPIAVSITTSACSRSQNLLKITVLPKKSALNSSSPRINVCGPILQDNFSNVFQLAQHFEMTSLLGAHSYFLYNFSSSNQIANLIRTHYSRYVTVIQWPMPIVLHDINYYGQLAAYADCLTRSIYRFSFTAVIDTDEIILPKRVNTWTAFIKSRFSTDKDTTGWLFHNVFMHYPKSFNSSIQPYNIPFLQRNLPGPIYAKKIRSKLLLRPECVLEFWIHFVYKHYPTCRNETIVPTDLGLNYHFRDDNGIQKLIPTPLDMYMKRFSNNLIYRLSLLDKKFIGNHLSQQH